METNLAYMPRHPLFNEIVAKNFFEKYAPQVRNWKHKLRGKDGNNSPIDFSKEDKKLIKIGVTRMTAELKSMELFGPM